MSRKIMQQALCALAESKPIDPQDNAAFVRSTKAIEALIKALAQPEQTAVSFPSFMRKRIEQALKDAIHPTGMSVHDGKVKVLVSDLHRMLLVIDSVLAWPEPTPRQLQRIRQEAWKNIKQDEYKFDPEVCFAMGFDAGYGAVARKVEPSQEECGGFDSRPAPRKPWVGLTDKERNEMIGKIQHDQYTRQRDLIGSTQIITEMYLKEKNGG